MWAEMWADCDWSPVNINLKRWHKPFASYLVGHPSLEFSCEVCTWTQEAMAMGPCPFCSQTTYVTLAVFLCTVGAPALQAQDSAISKVQVVVDVIQEIHALCKVEWNQMNAKVDLHGLKQASNDSTMILEMSWGTWDRSWTNSLDSLGVLLPSFALKSIVTHGLRANLLAITIWWASGIYDTSNHQDRNAWSDDVLPRIRIAAIKVPGSFTAFAKTNLFGTALILGLWRSILPENLGNRYLQATYIKSYRLIRNINIHQYVHDNMTLWYNMYQYRERDR